MCGLARNETGRGRSTTSSSGGVSSFFCTMAGGREGGALAVNRQSGELFFGGACEWSWRAALTMVVSVLLPAQSGPGVVVGLLRRLVLGLRRRVLADSGNLPARFARFLLITLLRLGLWLRPGLQEALGGVVFYDG